MTYRLTYGDLPDLRHDPAGHELPPALVADFMAARKLFADQVARIMEQIQTEPPKENNGNETDHNR